MDKRIIIHIGMPKTGSSAIQAFLSRNVDALASLGVSYPFPETDLVMDVGACSGNLIHVIQQRATVDRFLGNVVERVDAYLDPLIDEAISNSRTETVLLSGEFLGVHVTPARIDALEKLSRRHEVRVIAFVRDIYDWHLSTWKQRVKANGEIRDFREHALAAAHGGEGVLRRLPMILESGLDCRLLNYDRHRRDLIPVFLRAIGIDPDAPGLCSAGDRLHNPSLSYWQAKQVVMASRYAGSSRLAALLLDRFRSENDPRKDPVFDDIDRLLLAANAGLISRINALLPVGHGLRQTPRGGAAEVDVGFSIQDMSRFMQTVRTLLDGLDEKQRNSQPTLEGLPADFDPEDYLLRYPDVAAAGVDPAAHYLNHGRFEGRSYRTG